MTQNKKEFSSALITQIFSYDFPDADGGVYIYKVEVDSLPLSTFYLVSLDDTSTELAWGVGDTPQAALRAAVREWDRIYSDTPEEKNPFKEVYEKLEGEEQ